MVAGVEQERAGHSSKAPSSTCADSDPLAPSVARVTSANPSAWVHAVLAVNRRRAEGSRYSIGAQSEQHSYGRKKSAMTVPFSSFAIVSR